jgi:hypothetical protein
MKTIPPLTTGEYLACRAALREYHERKRKAMKSTKDNDEQQKLTRVVDIVEYAMCKFGIQ